MRGKNFYIKRCHIFIMKIHYFLWNISFSPVSFIFVRQFASFWALLFYFKRKVWAISEKNEHRRRSVRQKLAAVDFCKVSKKYVFRSQFVFSIKIFFFSKNLKFYKISFIATNENFGRTTVLWCSFFQKLSILCV